MQTRALSSAEWPENWRALLTSIGVSQRLAVACKGLLSALLVVKLIWKRSRYETRAEARCRCDVAEAFCWLAKVGPDMRLHVAEAFCWLVMSRRLGLFSKCAQNETAGKRHHITMAAIHASNHALCNHPHPHALCNHPHPPPRALRPFLPWHMSIHLLSRAFTPLPETPGRVPLPPVASKKRKIKDKT
jgi:hypothetical protein